MTKNPFLRVSSLGTFLFKYLVSQPFGTIDKTVFSLVIISECENPEPQEVSEKNQANPSDGKEFSGKDSSKGSSPSENSVSKAKSGNIPDKAVVILKKKAPVLTDKELNPEFFQKLETRGSGDLPVEVVVPRRYLNFSNSGNGVESGLNVAELRGRFNRMGNNSEELQGSSMSKYRSMDRGINGKEWRLRSFDDDNIDVNPRESTAAFGKTECQSEGGSFSSNKGNWIAIQRQLLQLERQQAHLMSMLQVWSKNQLSHQKLHFSYLHM